MPGPLVPLAAALVLYLAFVARQRTARAPLMDLGLLTRRPVSAGLLLILVATALTIAVFFLGTFYLQHLRGIGPLVTGLLFLPVALGTITGAQAAGRTIGTLGARAATTAGLALRALGIALPWLVGATPALVTGLAIADLGLGALFVAASATALGEVGSAETGLASGLLSTFHEFGAALGVAAAVR